MESYKMKKLNSNEFHEIKKSSYNKHDININLWDLEGSTFFVDKNINESESRRYNNHTSINSKNKSVSSKNITKDIKTMKTKNKSTHSSYVKYKNIIDKKNIKEEKAKSTLNNKKNRMKHNSFFGNKYEKNSFDNNLEDEYKKKANKKFNYSVDYSRNEQTNIGLLFSNNNDLNNKNQRGNSSLLIDTLNNKTDNKQNKINKNISSLKNNKNKISIKYKDSNKQEKTNFTEKNINNNSNMRNVKNINQNLHNNLGKKKKELKLNSDNVSSQQNRKRSTITKTIKENAEKYTNYLYKKKIFSHDYELQNKLKKEKDEKEAEKELAQCTFKPVLYTNKYNNRIQSQKNNHKNKSIYEKNSLWSNNLKKKKENELMKKLNKETEACTFNPQLSTLPKYKNKKSNISNREIIGETNYYDKMKKARKIKEEKKKGDDLVEKYDERKKKKETLPRSVVTSGTFNLEKSEASEESMNNNNYNNLKIERYSFKNNISDLNSNENIINNDISERSNNNYNNLNINKNNFIFSNTFSSNQVSMGNLEVSNKLNNNINIDTNKFLNDRIVLNKKSESSKNKIIPAIYYDIYNESSGKKPKNEVKEIMKNMNSNNKYQRENNYDFDNNFLDEKFFHKYKSNVINNINFLNPTIHYEEKEQEKENSTATVTKANSIVSLQKKSTHSLPDRPGQIENLLNFNLNDNKVEKTKDNYIINNKNIKDNLQDEEFIRQKKMLMNELHNMSDYNEDSNLDY